MVENDDGQNIGYLDEISLLADGLGVRGRIRPPRTGARQNVLEVRADGEVLGNFTPDQPARQTRDGNADFNEISFEFASPPPPTGWSTNPAVEVSWGPDHRALTVAADARVDIAPRFIKPGNPLVQMALQSIAADQPVSEPTNLISGSWIIDPKGQINGWLLDLGVPQHRLSLEMVAASRVIAETSTGLALRSPADNSWLVPIGFAITLPASAYGCGPVGLRLKGDTHFLPGAFWLPEPRLRFGGEVNWIIDEGLRVLALGWIRDRLRPDARLHVEAVLDGAILATALADRPLANIEESAGGYGFALQFPAGGSAFRKRGKIVIACSDWEVPVGPWTQFRLVAGVPDLLPAHLPEYDSASSGPIVGAVDAADGDHIAGWIRRDDEVGESVELLLEINGRPYMIAITRPAPLGRTANTPIARFLFDLPPTLTALAAIEYQIRALAGQAAIAAAEGTIPCRLAATPQRSGETLARFTAAQPVAQGSRSEFLPEHPLVSVIVLNLNGASVLPRLLDSIEEHEPWRPLEVIIIDHGSVDGSDIAAERPADFPLSVVRRGRNHSFSSSNNLAAEMAKGEVLLFVNNDIEWCGPIMEAMVDALRDPAVGVAGLMLRDKIVSSLDIGEGPIQHLGVHFDTSRARRGLQAFEMRDPLDDRATAGPALETPVVTGSVMACWKSDFTAINGFSNVFFYGFEDVDFCLRMQRDLALRVVCCTSAYAAHRRGWTRDGWGFAGARHERNRQHLEETHMPGLKRLMREMLLKRPGYWTGLPPVIAFAVSETAEGAVTGDPNVAAELGAALSELIPAAVIFLDPPRWYDLAGVDVLIALLDDYDPRQIKEPALTVTLVAWARNWFDRWCTNPAIDAFHHVWASSETAAGYMREKLLRPVEVVRLATNLERFEAATAVPALSSDYCFVGNYWGYQRELTYALRPSCIKAHGRVFGSHWDNVPEIASVLEGPVPYDTVPEVFASTKIVIDDANSATAKWGSVNSRVFDGIAAGKLVISNGAIGVKEIFGNTLPVWRDGADLANLIHHYLADEEARLKTAMQLRKTVIREHSYRHRASQVAALLRDAGSKLRFSLKVPAPGANPEQEWGDRYFGEALATALRALGHLVRVDYVENWYGPISFTDDIVVVLRGVARYRTNRSQLNLLWVISHPDSVSRAEFTDYDGVFVASADSRFITEIAASSAKPVSSLLQCTDPGRFYGTSIDPGVPPHPVLFVGNAREVFRPMLRWAVQLGIDVAVYGSGWEPFLPTDMIRARSVPHILLPTLYRKAGVVLNDHWADMARCGMMSNRLFDAVIAGATVISDPVEGISRTFGSTVRIVRTPEELQKAIRETEAEGAKKRADRARLAASLADEHSFTRRAKAIERTAVNLLAQRSGQISTSRDRIA